MTLEMIEELQDEFHDYEIASSDRYCGLDTNEYVTLVTLDILDWLSTQTGACQVF